MKFPLSFLALAMGCQLYCQPSLSFLEQNDVREAISSIGGPEEVHFTELKGGMTSTKLYTFEILGKKYVLRMLSGRQSFEERQHEIRAHQIGASLGIAPELIYVSQDLRVMVMPFIEGHTLTSEDLKNKDVIEALGILLSKLHSYPGEFHHVRTQNDRVRKHYERSVKKGVALPSLYQKLYDEYMAEGEVLNTQYVSLCHADLNPANILVSQEGKLWIIDWAAATGANRYTDLGYLTFNSGFSDEQSYAFLTAYFQREPTLEEWENLKKAQKRTSFLTATVWFDFSESEQEKTIPFSDRIKTLDALLDSKELKLGQDYIAEGNIVSPTSGQPEAIKLFALGFLKTYLTF